MKKERRLLMNNMNNSQPSVSVYTFLSQVQSLYSQYIQVKTQLDLLENNLNTSTIAFNTIPTQQNLLGVENAWNQKLLLMRQLPQIVNGIVVNLVEATKMALTSMQLSLATNNRINIVLNDNAIASICSIVEQNSQQLYIKELYRQFCIAQNIPMVLSSIKVSVRMNRINIPNFERLHMLINGY